MNKRSRKTLLFAGKSMLWAFLLFGVVMSLLNWAELRSTIKGQYVVVASPSDTTLYKIGPAGIEAIQKLLGKTGILLHSF